MSLPPRLHYVLSFAVIFSSLHLIFFLGAGIPVDTPPVGDLPHPHEGVNSLFGYFLLWFLNCNFNVQYGLIFAFSNFFSRFRKQQKCVRRIYLPLVSN